MSWLAPFLSRGAGYIPNPEAGLNEAFDVLCARRGCKRPAWNGQHGEYCGRRCRGLATPAAGATCARHGCENAPWNGQRGEYCSFSCRGNATPATGVTCARKGCNNAPFNGQQGECCSKRCRDSLLPAASTAPAGAHCAQATQEQFARVQEQFQSGWNRGTAPKIRAIYKIHASSHVRDAYQRKCSSIGRVKPWGRGDPLGNQQCRFHGTRITCTFSGQPCTNSGCRACSIIKNGFSIQCLSSNTGNQGSFGPGHYASAKSSTAHGYGNALIMTLVAVGVADVVQNPTSAPLPPGTHSRVANKSTGNDELMAPHDDQMLPLYLILF
ncbi:unnamed protein product [Effrenium voratum]|uniref:Uncharacterized protein n=1 Tax=Effrenium voratum TaxID=2562239 RepID=A0AA36MWG8_9DINO|nr:unnamed protein product [Effrenium voratum]